MLLISSSRSGVTPPLAKKSWGFWPATRWRGSTTGVTGSCVASISACTPGGPPKACTVSGGKAASPGAIKAGIVSATGGGVCPLPFLPRTCCWGSSPYMVHLSLARHAAPHFRISQCQRWHTFTRHPAALFGHGLRYQAQQSASCLCIPKTSWLTGGYAASGGACTNASAGTFDRHWHWRCLTRGCRPSLTSRCLRGPGQAGAAPVGRLARCFPAHP